MVRLIMVIMLPPVISFACGYGVRDWMSRRRRREVRKKFYERCKPDAHAPTTETTSVATRRELTIRELQERLSRLEDRIADATLEIEAFREEARSEFASTRDLLERKLEKSSTDQRRLLAAPPGQQTEADRPHHNIVVWLSAYWSQFYARACRTPARHHRSAQTRERPQSQEPRIPQSSKKSVALTIKLNHNRPVGQGIRVAASTRD